MRPRNIKKLTVLKAITIVSPVVVVWILEQVRLALIPETYPFGLGNLIVIVILLIGSFLLSSYIFSIIEKSEKDNARKNKELSALNSVSLAFSESLDLDTILETALEQVADMTSADASDVWLFREGTQDIVRRGYCGEFSSDTSAKKAESVVSQISKEVGQEARLRVIPDIRREESPNSLSWAFNNYISMVSIPMIVQKNAIGVLNIFGRQPEQFTTENIRILENMTNYISLAVANADLYDKIQAVATSEERERIAREMHDGLAQVLSYVNAKSQAARQYLQSGKPELATEQLKSLEKVANELYEDIRETILNLRTTISSNGNFSSVLQDYLTRFSQMSGIETTLEKEEGDINVIPPEVEIQVIRIVQEALANVRKHSMADSATVKLAFDENEFKVIIEDEGQGFDTSIQRRDSNPHFGFQIMKERAGSIKGNLDVVSFPGKGTRVTLCVPKSEG